MRDDPAWRDLVSWPLSCGDDCRGRLLARVVALHISYIVAATLSYATF